MKLENYISVTDLIGVDTTVDGPSGLEKLLHSLL